MRPLVPMRDPSAIADDAKRFGGDDEKIATTTLKGLEYRGVHLSSRYDKGHEYEDMMNMMETLEDAEVAQISSIFCDSKACATYVVQTSCRGEELLNQLGDRLSAICVERNGGYNGLLVEGGDKQVFFNPDWVIEYPED